MRHQVHISKGIFLERRFNEIESILRKDHGSPSPRDLHMLSLWPEFLKFTFLWALMWQSEGHQEEDVPPASTLGFPWWPNPKAKYTGTVSLAQISYVWLLSFLCLTTLQTSKGTDNISNHLPGHSLQSLPPVGFSTMKNFLLHICWPNRCRGPLPANRFCRRGYHHQFTGAKSHHGRYSARIFHFIPFNPQIVMLTL